METSQYLKRLVPLFNKIYFTSKEARDIGVPSVALCYYQKIGRIKRIRHGLYQSSDYSTSIDFRWEDLIEEVYSVSGGVVCLISALAIYELTDEIPRQHWIAVSNKTTAKVESDVKIMRFRNMTLGRIEISLDGVQIPIFDRERCIVDAFRLLSKEIAIKALRAALSPSYGTKIDVVKLQNYAKKLRVNINPYLIAVTT